MKKIIIGSIIVGAVAGITTAIIKKVKKNKKEKAKVTKTTTQEDDEIASVFEDIKEGLQEAIDYEKNKEYSLEDLVSSGCRIKIVTTDDVAVYAYNKDGKIAYEFKKHTV